MTPFQTKLLYTFLPYVIGFALSWSLLAFITWERNPELWLFADRLIAAVIGAAIGSALFIRFEYDRFR
jgi:hypothetical protein